MHENSESILYCLSPRSTQNLLSIDYNEKKTCFYKEEFQTRADVIAFEGNHLLSRLIQWVTKTRVSHIGIMVGDHVLMESVLSGVRLRKLTHKEPTFHILRNDELSLQQKRKIVSFVLHKVNVKYDLSLFIGIGLNRLFHINTQWNNNARYICVELVVDAYKSVGVDLLPNLPSANMIPDDLMNSEKLKKVNFL